MLKHTMVIGALVTVLGLAGFVLSLPFAAANVNQIVTSYREEFDKTELVFETDGADVNQIRFFGDVNVRLKQSEGNQISVYRMSKRAEDDSLRILRTRDMDRSYLNITGNTDKYGGGSLLDRLFSLTNDQTFEEITVYIPKTVEISANGLNGDIFGLLDVEYLNSYAGTLVEPETAITMEEIRQKHLAIEQNIEQYELDMDTLMAKYVEGKMTDTEFEENEEGLLTDIAYEVEKVVRMLASHYQLMEQHVSLITGSTRTYLELKYEHKLLLLQHEKNLTEYRQGSISQDRYQERKEAFDEREQGLAFSLEEAEERLARYENIYLGGFDLIS